MVQSIFIIKNNPSSLRTQVFHMLNQIQNDISLALDELEPLSTRLDNNPELEKYYWQKLEWIEKQQNHASTLRQKYAYLLQPITHDKYSQ